MKRMLTSKMISSLFLLGVLTLSMHSVYGQVTFGAITGSIKDSSGAEIPNAQIEILNQGTNEKISTKTNASGGYFAPDLPPGTYTVIATKPGFKTFAAKNVQLNTQQTVRIDIELQIGSTTTTVLVSGAAPIINTDTPTISTTIDSKQLTDTATNLRSTASATGDSGIFGLINLVPTGYQSSGARFSMGGARGSEDNFNVDGISSNSPAYGNYIGDLQPSFAMISQVNYEVVNVPAEYGPVVNVTTLTKSGTNTFHGSIFEYNQNTSLNALDYFATSRTPNVYNDFGVALGGPMIKNKLFFYAVYEGDRKSTPAIVVASVPSLKMRTGDFSQLLGQYQILNPYTGKPYVNNIIPQQYLNASALKWQSLFTPSPNYGSPESYANNFRGVYPQSISHNEGDLRIDWIPNQRNHLYGRYLYKVSEPKVLDSGLPPSITGYRVQQRVAQQFELSETWIASPNLVNEAKIGFSRDRNSFGGALHGQKIINEIGMQGLPNDPSNTANIPNVSINGFSSPQQLSKSLPTQNSFQYIDQLTWVKGNHVFKMGGEFKPQQYNSPVYTTFGGYGFTGQFSDFAYSDFLLGLPGSTNYTYNRPSQYSRVWFLNGFIQDDWKIRSNLNLSYGLRYDYYSPGRDALNAVSNFDPQTGKLVVPNQQVYDKYVNPAFAETGVPVETAAEAGLPQRQLRNAFKLGFEPRLGFSWRPFRNTNTSVHGGYGIFRDELTADIFSYLYGAPFGLTKTYVNKISNGAPLLTFTDPFAGSYSVGTVTASALDKNLTSPLVQQWSLSVEQAIGQNTGVRISYIGLKASKLIYGKNLNQPHAGLAPYNPETVPYPIYQGIYYETNGAWQNYNAMTVEINRHMHHGLMFNAAYTWSKNLTNDDEVGDVEGGVTIEDTYDLKREKGNAEFDPRSRFVSSMVWQLPLGRGQRFFNHNGFLNEAIGGWQISADYTAQTGQYYTPQFSGSDPSNTNTYGGRPDIIGNPNLPKGQRSINHWFNTAAFAVPQPGHFGTARNGSVEGPDQNSLNAAMFKSFQIHGRLSLRLQGSFTNILNHPNFGEPNMNISTGSSAGVISSTTSNSFSGARSGQIGARLTF